MWSTKQFPSNHNKIWKFLPIMVELQISEIWENPRNMGRCILEVKYCKTRMLIENLFVYHFADPGGWQNLWKTRSSRKSRYWFSNRGLKHFHTFALVVEENFIYKLSTFLFFGDKKSCFWKLYTSSPSLFTVTVSHMKTRP